MSSLWHVNTEYSCRLLRCKELRSCKYPNIFCMSWVCFVWLCECMICVFFCVERGCCIFMMDRGMLEVTEWHTDNVSDNGITLQKTRSARVEDKSVSNASLFTHFNCCSAGSNIILTNSYNLSQNATHTNYSLLWPLFSDRRRSILTRAVFRSLWKNDTGWSWYSDTTSDMTGRDAESLILFVS